MLRPSIILPRKPISRVRAGEMIKIIGRLRATAGAFTAPLSGATCVWHSSAVQLYRRVWYSGQALDQRRWQDVFVDDGTGVALVRMGRADVRLQEMREPWCYEPPVPGDERYLATTENVRNFVEARGATLRYHETGSFERPLLFALMFGYAAVPDRRAARYREAVLREGDVVAVAGVATLQPDPTVPALRGPTLRLVLGEAPETVIVSNLPVAWS